MKTTTKKTIWSFYGLCLIFMVYACKNQEAEPLKPYTFDSLRDLQMPGLRQSAPPPVTVTPATLTPSSQAAQVRSDIASMTPSGPVPGSVSQAANDMNTALTSVGVSPTTLSSSFTPMVVSNLTAGGKLPQLLQVTINSLVAHPAMQKYYMGFTYPKVNNQEVGPTTITITGPGVVAIVAIPLKTNPIHYPSTGDPCFKQANDKYDDKIFGLEDDRKSQEGTVESTYSQGKTDAEAEIQPGISGKLNQYNTLVSNARQELTMSLNNLNAVQTTLGTTTYNLLVAYTYVVYTQQVQVYFNMLSAELNTISIKATVKIASVKFARDTDMHGINSNFNETIRTALRIVLSLYDSCHNQGTGH